MSFDEASGRFANGSIDLLHLDGCHSYAAVKHDFETWLPKVSAGEIILVHDIAAREGTFGAWRFWEEVSGRYPSFAFQHSSGLGILAHRKAGLFENRLLEALLGGTCDPDAVRDYVLRAKRLEDDRLKNAPDATFQVFWPGSTGYSEEHSATTSVPLGQWVTLTLDMPAAEGRLRVDPASIPAFIEISQMAVEYPSAGTVL
jgi:hypothetical protein